MGYVESLMGANEQIVVRTRQHWMVLVASLVGDFAASIVIIVVAILATVFGAMVLGPLAAFAPVLLVLLVFPLVDFLRSFLDWWNEEYLVTNRRVVQAEGTINKHVIDSSLEKVNDVVLNQSILGRIMDYGDIEILTASEIGVNKLHKIASPVRFKTEMLNQKEALGNDEHFGHSGGGKQDVPALIAELDQLRKQGVLTEAEFDQKKAQLLSKM